MAIDGKTAEGSAAANGKHGHTLISDAKFRQLYGLALRVSTAAALDGAMRSMAGREAALAGVTADLRADDCLIAEQGSEVLKLLRGDLAAQVRTLKGKAPDDLVVGALGRAMEDRLRGNGRVTVVFLPERTGDPLQREARALAAEARLPLIFVEDEPAAIAGPAARKGRGAGKDSGKGAWMAEIPVDAEDVVAMYRVAHESMTRARQGGGPTLIVCSKWQPAARGRKQQPVQGGAVEKLEIWLASRGLPAQDWRQEIAAAGKRRG